MFDVRSTVYLVAVDADGFSLVRCLEIGRQEFRYYVAEGTVHVEKLTNFNFLTKT
jgi:hypothetical protein